MRVPAVILVALALAAPVLAGLGARARVWVSDPVMEPYRSYVEASGIPDWPVTYRGHVLRVRAEWAESAIIPDEPREGADARPPSVGYTLVYSRADFRILNETLLYYNVTTAHDPSLNATIATVRVGVEWLLLVRENASCFERRDWSGNYSRRRVYVEWTITHYTYHRVNGTWRVEEETARVDDYPEPEYLRIYARQPTYGLDLQALVEGSPRACNWSAARLLVRISNPALGVPPPNSSGWGSLLRLRPGQLVVEGLELTLTLKAPNGSTLGVIVWRGSLGATLGWGLTLNATPRDPWAARRILVEPRATAAWDAPGGPTRAPVGVGPGEAELPWTWVTILEAPADTVRATSRVGGRSYEAHAPWPARLCLPPGSYRLTCNGCPEEWIVASDPATVRIPRAPKTPPTTPPTTQPPPRLAWILTLLATVLAYAITWLLAPRE